VLDELTDTPAQILNDLGDVLAQNAIADAALGTICSVREGERNFIWRWFMEPSMRAPYPADELEDLDRYLVSNLRVTATRRGNDAASTELIDPPNSPHLTRYALHVCEREHHLS